MTTKRRMDDQGRIIIPSHIRKNLNLATGSLVEVGMADDETITIKPTTDNCCICGKSLGGKDALKVTKTKTMCLECAEAVPRVI